MLFPGYILPELGVHTSVWFAPDVNQVAALIR